MLDVNEIERLEEQVELLGSRDWKVVAGAWKILVSAGQAALDLTLEGLSHSSPRIRRGCADFLDHYGDDSCITKLQTVALHDPVPHVRMAAVHALLCQRCKTCPLSQEITPFLVQVATSDSNTRVRQEAIYGLGGTPNEPLALETLHRLLAEEITSEIRRAVHASLIRGDANYREAMNRKAREEGIARAQAKECVTA